MKGYVGISNLIVLGGLELTAIAMSSLKMLNIKLNQKVLKIIRLIHIVRRRSDVLDIRDDWSIVKHNCDVGGIQNSQGE